jgi:hypothetical protein
MHCRAKRIAFFGSNKCRRVKNRQENLHRLAPGVNSLANG